MLVVILAGCKVREDYTSVHVFEAITPDLAPPSATPLRIEILRELVVRVEGDEAKGKRRSARLVLAARIETPGFTLEVREWTSDWSGRETASGAFTVTVRDGIPRLPDGCDPLLGELLAAEAARLARPVCDDPLAPPGPIHAGTGWPRDVGEVLAHPLAAPFVDLPHDASRSSAYAQAAGIVIGPKRVRWSIGLHARVTPLEAPPALLGGASLPGAPRPESVSVDLRARQVGDVKPSAAGALYDREELVRATARWTMDGKAVAATLTETRRRRPGR